ncbi:hypothetical protein G6011_09167 [Alternaria panax]|uniref:Zn(2)-C6 fungal-type domain-containing protein n=1 Tax=Alternaria panax TaxID=48097 RepID=A0AAD4NPJ4_9PLEO|nr:hypothetical protein G6011_09167 [Alternaria panax]
MQQDSPLTEATPIPRGESFQSSGDPSPSDHSGKGASRRSKITRKSHRKSRAGCVNCKSRRIKCDEGKPFCAHCKRRQVRCEYPATTATSTAGLGVMDPKEPGGLPISEIELTYHWITTTCHSFSSWPIGVARIQALTEEIAMKNEHVLHLMFAFTALHLAVCRPDRKEHYTATADHHYKRALALVTPEIAGLNPDNCDAVLQSVQLICFVGWARGPQAGEYLAFGKHGRSDWLVMFRGIRTTLNTFERDGFTKTHAPNTRSKGRLLPPSDGPFEYEKQLRELKEHIEFVSEDFDRDDNVDSVVVLQEMYSNRYGGKDEDYHIAFGWLYRMSDEFLERLQRCDLLPLIIYAHFVVLMHDMEKFWYMKGWTCHVMSGIYEALPTEHKTYISWPMASVGWIAP